MKEDEWESNDHGWFLGSIGFIIFLFFILRNDWKRNVSKCSTRCDSTDCVRCNQLKSISDLQRRLQKFYTTTDSEPPSIDTSIGRVEHLLNSGLTAHSVYASILEESGYGTMSNIARHIPQVWMLPGLTRKTFWSERMDGIYSKLLDIKLASEDPNLITDIKMELAKAKKYASGWKTNSTPSGKWRIFSFYNQGTVNETNCAMCPRTVHFLSTINLFMCDHVYGNALFSILEPGSHIEPHAGPCNYRLRCHLPLTVPSGFKIRVGMDASIWEEGKLMIFDDSFIHEVWSDLNQEKGRAVLIFDIWHPEVSLLEKAAIKYIFY